LLGCALRQYRVSTYQAGQGPGGHGRLGCNTLIKPAKVKGQDHLAALGRRRKRGQARPQGQLLRPRNPIMRGWANYSRVGVSHAVYERLDHLPWITRRHWARWRHPRPSTAWAIRRYWHRVGTRLPFATSATDPAAVPLLAHSEVPMTRHVQVQGNRRPYEGAWVYWSTRQGRPPNVGARLARWRKRHHGRCRRWGLFCQHDDRMEMDHVNGHHRESRSVTLQALHGPCHDAKTREQGD
jgi:RNA-directed DNA polymerase